MALSDRDRLDAVLTFTQHGFAPDIDHDRQVFDLVNGLPVHPLVVHAAVMFVPLTLLGTILLLVRRKWRKNLGWWVVLLAGAGLVASFVAK